MLVVSDDLADVRLVDTKDLGNFPLAPSPRVELLDVGPLMKTQLAP
jgi:hypothetical protein